MKKIVLSKIILIMFFGYFQNIFSQSKKIDEINESISYWENDYSFENHLRNYDRSICARSLGGRGSIYNFSKIGNRKYNVVFINLVNSDMSEITVDYSDKPVPSQAEYKNYITNKINLLRKDIESENKRLLIIENRRLANIEFQKKQKAYIEKEQYKLRKSLDSLLNKIQSHIDGTNSFYEWFVVFDDEINLDKDFNYFQIKKDSLFGLPLNFFNDVFAEIYPDIKYLNVIPEDPKLPDQWGRPGTEEFSINEHIDYGFKSEFQQKNKSDIYQIDLKDEKSIKTLINISYNYLITKTGLEGSYTDYSVEPGGFIFKDFDRFHESIVRYLLFQKFIEPNRWISILNQNSNYFNYKDIDTTGFKLSGDFKWRNNIKNSSVVSDLFKWYEVENNLIFDEGFNYDKLIDRPYVNTNTNNFGKTDYERMIEEPEKYEEQLLLLKKNRKWRDKTPPDYILNKIYSQYRVINFIFDYFKQLGYVDFESKDIYTDKLIDDMEWLKLLTDQIKSIKLLDDFILDNYKTMFSLDAGGDLYISRKKLKKFNSLKPVLQGKSKLIHDGLIGEGNDVNLRTNFFYTILKYGEREHYDVLKGNISTRTTQKPQSLIKYRIERNRNFFLFIITNEIFLEDVENYIKTMKNIINQVQS